MKANPTHRPHWSSERGSFIVAMIFFIFLFLIVAAMGVDMGRYFYVQQQNQNIADGTALAAAQAFNQVRSLSQINRSRMTDAAFHHIAQRTGYDTRAYELSATFEAGDLLSDSFVDATQADYLGDTYIRVGMNVKYYFEPYFLPRWAFGDEFFAVQSQAVAELHPVYWQSNLYDPVEPGPPVPSLQYAIYSQEDIKPENQDCFVVNGTLHADSGYLKTEKMTDGAAEIDHDCTDGSQNWGLDEDGDGTPGEGHFYVDGDIEVGDPSGSDDSCSGKTPGPGCMVFSEVEGKVSGDLTAQDFIDNCQTTTPPCPTVGGDVNSGSPNVPQVTPELIDSDKTPDDDPDAYPGDVCTIETSDTVTLTSKSDFVDEFDSDDCSTGGTIYIRDNDDDPSTGGGNVTLEGMNPSTSGDFTFISDGAMNIQNVNGDNGHFENDKFMFMSRHQWIKMQGTSGDIEMDATFYAPKVGDLTQDKLCAPNQRGCIKIEANSGDLTINGSVVAGTLAKIEEQHRFRMNWEANTDRLPNHLRQWVQMNDIPDYWEIHLID